MTPAEPQPQGVEQVAPNAAEASAPAQGWSRKLGAVLFATFCLEIGLFLLIFPWTPWADDFARFRPAWSEYFSNPFVRGAISGLGVVNLYVAFVEIIRLRRFAKR
jgi:hypothetical protein